MLFHILACTAFGSLWRHLKGGANVPLASWTFAPMTLLPIVPLIFEWWPAWWLVAWAVCAGASALFLLVKADNGGDGEPLRRFGPFGLGYWWADRFHPAWHATLGEPWLGGTWFGSVALVSWIIYAWRIGA